MLLHLVNSGLKHVRQAFLELPQPLIGTSLNRSVVPIVCWSEALNRILIGLSHLRQSPSRCGQSEIVVPVSSIRPLHRGDGGLIVELWSKDCPSHDSRNLKLGTSQEDAEYVREIARSLSKIADPSTMSDGVREGVLYPQGDLAVDPHTGRLACGRRRIESNSALIREMASGRFTPMLVNRDTGEPISAIDARWWPEYGNRGELEAKMPLSRVLTRLWLRYQRFRYTHVPSA